ncbi:MAG: NUDIX domain-containing protein, partial [Rhodobiaceae bacterium]|nr:NUDIX domain-containing protein [Rhodobiaceae bacterium]
MDLGATICTPKSPSCLSCPWSASCAARAAGTETAFPVKAAKKARPVRHGHAWFVRDGQGRVLLRRRPDKGLLGGMTEIPTSDWLEGGLPAIEATPIEADFRALPGEVRHVFTHFELRLTVHAADARIGTAPPGGFWVDEADLEDEALPSVMRKVAAHAIRNGG